MGGNTNDRRGGRNNEKLPYRRMENGNSIYKYIMGNLRYMQTYERNGELCE